MIDPRPVVLVVEDDEDDVLFISFAFEQAEIDCDLRNVSDGLQAIDYLSGKGLYQDRIAHPLPVVALIDLKLPKKSGHEVLSWIASQASLESLIRIVLTGSDDPEDLAKSYRMGAHGYFSKPLSKEQLTGPGRNLRAILMGGAAVSKNTQVSLSAQNAFS